MVFLNSLYNKYRVAVFTYFLKKRNNIIVILLLLSLDSHCAINCMYASIICIYCTINSR